MILQRGLIDVCLGSGTELWICFRHNESSCNSVVLSGRSLRQTAVCDSLQSVSSLEKESAHYIRQLKQRLAALSEVHHICLQHWKTTLSLRMHFCSCLIVGVGLSHCCILSGGDCKAWRSSTTAVQQRPFDLQVCIISFRALPTSQVYFYVTWWPCYCAFYHIQKGKECMPTCWLAVLVMMIVPSYMMVIEGMSHEVPVLSSSHL
jgi:hypothetical protein